MLKVVFFIINVAYTKSDKVGDSAFSFKKSEMEKRGDGGDASVLFFSLAVLIFLAMYGKS